MEHIAYKDVSISYDNHEVLSNFNFEINRGEIVSLFGPSGCGKTTLMKALLGIVSPTSGEIKVNAKGANKYNKAIGYVPQDNQLLPWLSVEENIRLWLQPADKDSQKVDRTLKLVDLIDQRKKLPKQLSGGMLRRTALARGLVTNAAILCLDEVLVSIEREMRRHVMVEIRSYVKKNQISTLLVSHDYEEVVFLSDKILVLSATPTEILKTLTINEENRDVTFFDSESFELYCKNLIA